MFKKIKNSGAAPYLFMAAFLITAKLLLISVYGNATPYWDQWEAEANLLYRPWLEGNLAWTDFFSAHNEHRIFTTRVLALLLLELNGRIWDPILQMGVNAVLHALALCTLVYFSVRTLPEDKKSALFIFVAAIFSIPFGWENTLAGFQSQFYFLLFFSFIFLWSMASCKTYSPQWWGGVVTGLLCTVSLASGTLTIIAGISILILRRALDRSKSNVALSATFPLAAIAIISFVTTPNIPGHASLKAHSVLEFLQALRAILSWPDQKTGLGLLVIHLPLAIFMLKVVRDPSFRTSGHYFIVAVGIWLIGQFVSIAYGRALGFNSSRYLDLFAVGLVAGFVSLLVFLNDEKSNKLVHTATLIWISIVALGFITSSHNLANELKTKALQSKEQEQNVRNYLCTNDAQNIYGKPFLYTPFPDPDRLKFFLDNPQIRSILPGNIYGPNANHPIAADGEPFCPPGHLVRPFSPEAWDGKSTSNIVATAKVLIDGWKGTDYSKSKLPELKVFGSMAQSDNDTGFITILVRRGEKVLFHTGPRVKGQFILINNGGIGKFYTEAPIAAEWALLSFDNTQLPDEFEVTFIDAGTGWGEWSAIALLDTQALSK